MGKQKQSTAYLLWFVVCYLVGRLMFSGYVSVQLAPDPSSQAPCLLAGGPQESLGDGPGNA